MRGLLLLLPLCTVVAAEPSFLSALSAFEKARKQLRQPGEQARVLVAVDELAATHDTRATRHLAALVVQTMEEEADTFDRIKAIQQDGARAHERREQLDREIRHLKLKERAGDRTAGPEIQKRAEEMERTGRVFEDVKLSIERLTRVVGFVRDVRERAVAGAGAVVAKQADETSARGAVGSLFEALDVADRAQGLYLVRILAAAPRTETEPYLVRILEHPKTGSGVRRKACYALSDVLGRTGADALVSVARRDTDGLRRAALHSLSLAAKRRIADVEEATEFAKSLP